MWLILKRSLICFQFDRVNVVDGVWEVTVNPLDEFGNNVVSATVVMLIDDATKDVFAKDLVVNACEKEGK